MRLLVKITALGIGLLFLCYFIVRIWTVGVLEHRIASAKSNYSGTAEDALIEMLKDETISARDKTHIAVWTLGQIRADNALPVLKELYKNDPEGLTCYRKHDTEICQYELYKAIQSIEGKTLLSFSYLNN